MNEQQKEETIASSVRARTMQYVTAGFGLVAGLAWNDAITSFIAYTFPKGSSTIGAKFIYAIILTIVLVVITIYLRKILTKLEHLRGNEKD